MATNPPLLFSSTGPIATPPATLQAALIALVEQLAPGYTAALPGIMIEDMTSTGTGILSIIDQARVDTVNSVTPYAANPYLLSMLGYLFGIPIGTVANANAFEVFTGSPGYVIPPGFMVGDGTNAYAIQDGGTVGSNGMSQLLFVVCTNSSTFAIPANSITSILTSVPTPYTLTCTNPSAGISATQNETFDSYRNQIARAFQVALSGSATYIKTLVWAVPGVSQRLVSVRQVGTQWEVIVGGGDPYQVAGAIYQGVSSVGLLTGSPISSARNVNVSIFDVPDSYSVLYVDPPQQLVTVALTWNTNLPNFTSQSSVNQLMIPATQNYINGITVGNPINLLQLQQYIQEAIASVLNPANLTRLIIAVQINSILVSPTPGTLVIPSDPESYFYCAANGVTAAQG